MNRILPLIVLAISIASYIAAPNDYSFGYCYFIQWLFLIEAICLYVFDLRNEKVGFNLLFSISFYFTSFVFPVYIYPVDPHYSLFSFSYNSNVISRCTALAQIAYSCYVCGYLWNINIKQSSGAQLDFGFAIPGKIVRRTEILIAVLFILFLLIGGIDYFEDRYLRNNMSRNLLVQYLIQILTPIAIFLSSLILLVQSKSQVKSIYLILIAIAFILMTSGTRTIPLFILSAIFLIFCYRHKVSLPIIIVGVIFGTIILAYIGQIRNQGVFTGFNYRTSEFGWLEGFSDLFINNRSIYILYDYVQNHGCMYGLSMASDFLSPIPFAQSIFRYFTGVPDSIMGSANFVTFLQFGVRAPLGLGTHVVGDVYLAFGMPGVIILFAGLGLFITYIRDKMRRGSYYYFLIYLTMVSYAIYMCRSSFFGTLRNLVWALLLSYLILNRYAPRKQNR